MHQSSNHSKFQRMRRRLDLFRRKKRNKACPTPCAPACPFSAATGVLMTTVVTAASCTLCYRVDAQGQSLAFFHDVATYDAAVSQAETRASKILETQYSLNQDLSVRATLAPKDQIDPVRGHRLPHGEHPGAGTRLHPLCGRHHGGRRAGPFGHHPGSEPGEGTLHHPGNPLPPHRQSGRYPLPVSSRRHGRIHWRRKWPPRCWPSPPAPSPTPPSRGIPWSPSQPSFP